MKKSALNLFFILISICVSGQNSRKVLFIGIDGCRADALTTSATPAIDNLLINSIYSLNGLCAYKTWSGNGWSSMLTGVWHTKHGVTDNTFTGSNYINYPDFISRLETFDSTLRTVTSVHWAPINDVIIQNADSERTYATDLEVKNGAVDALTNDDPDLLFVAFDDVDHAGHTYGFSPLVPQYIQAIEITEGYVAEIITALHNRPNYANEEWLVVLTTDHGGNMAGHGGGTLEERTIFTIYSSPDFVQQELNRTEIAVTDTFNEAHFNTMTYAQPVAQTPFLFGATQDFTIEFWVKADLFTDDPAFISNKDWNSGLNPGFVISAQAGQYWKVNIGDGVDRLDIQGGTLLPGEWHHLAVSFDRDGLMTAYEDGIVVSFDKMQNIDNINSGLPLVINQDGTTTYAFNFSGSYKDIRIWNAALPASTILHWANVPVTALHPNYNDLLANWKCENNLASVLDDESINNNDCAIFGPITWNVNQTETFSVYDYSTTTREPDNAVTVLNWMCVPIQPSWDLDGTSRVLPCSNVAVNENDYSLGMEIFPNPVNDFLTVKFGDLRSEKTNLKIYDSTGRLVFNQDEISERDEMEISALRFNSGIYILKVSSESIVSTLTFVVQ